MDTANYAIMTYLNTSYVKVQRPQDLKKGFDECNLNTSYVKVQQ